MNWIKQLRPFSFFEKIDIIKYRAAKILLRNSSKDLRTCYHLTSKLIHQGIKIKGNKGKLRFGFPINGRNVNFELDKISSDIHVFQQIVVLNEYSYIIDLMKANNIACVNMIDAGANIGLTSLYFNAFFPNINIIALEPSNKNFSRLEKNINANGLFNVTLLKKGLWSCATRLKGDESFRDSLDWSFRLVSTDNEDEALFDVVSLKDIIEEYQIQQIDFLKIDIEGSEVEVFKEGNELDWLKIVKVIAIEIHNEFNCKEKIKQILIENEFKLSYSGELTVGINQTI